MLSERQIADALARRRKDRVADRGRHWWHPRFADAGGRRVARYKVHARVNRTIVDARHRIIMKIRLLDGAARGRDLAHQGDAGPEHRSALELRFHAVRIDHLAHIRRNVYTRNAKFPARVYFHFNDRGDVTQETP